MELRHLRYFVAIAEELNFQRAAKKLNISQPPLSKQIRDLERELGVDLVDRSKRKIKLTHAGRLFLGDARSTLESAERSVRTAVRAGRGEIGRLAMGFLGSATYGVLPEMLRGFRERYPQVQLQLQTMSNRQQIEAFREERIEVGILRPDLDESVDFLSTRTISHERLIAVLPSEHRLVETHLSLSGLANEDFILWPRSHGTRTRDRIIGLCERAGFNPRVVQESTELQTTLGLVAAGMGVSLLIGKPEHMLGHDRVAYKVLEEPDAVFELALAWRKDGLSSIVRAFLESSEQIFSHNY